MNSLNYTETIDWLFSNLPMFQKVGKSAFKKDLTNIEALTAYLGNPHKKFRTIHVAGTNGKGSTSHMLASVLQEAGYKVGLTTSPHLKDFRERIRVNGELCSKDFVIEFVAKHHQKIIDQHASFFEIAIAMAFAYFAEQEVDVAVIETGLGGRLDSTNIISPDLSVITNIGLDHTQFLGNTLSEIAGEKAGIIKANTPVVIGEATPETRKIFEQHAEARNAKIIFAEEHQQPKLASDLKGIYQQKNIQTVLNAIKELKNLVYSIDQNAVEKGLKNVVKNTKLRGRWDILQKENPTIVADTAHNPHGLKLIAEQLSQTNYSRLHLVLGFVNDKDVLESLSFFPKEALYYFTQPDVPRKFEINELKKIIPKNLDARYYNSVTEAIDAAKSAAFPDDLIYIGGSTFVVAEAI
ncbi:bifunctional folylpolyglutamate synthase/dihydrofolate synthase [Vaginella massiliensis]|uniref:bifunctional folylpolyglutamate synthase/dihydrofolate synthase n=1 Tax=Vaginella massiliensis TaxID=1816680 RepID=UPI0008394632|nr:folylpolyglutamate synthase/dihydrofolate synthase family protein [Vaginella massiliensis]